MIARVGVLTVGDEILSGSIVDRHSAWISTRLNRLGFPVAYHQSIGDDEGALARALSNPPAAAEAVIVTGGLGPTDDDRTRSEIAGALGVETEFRPESWADILAYYAALGRTPTEINRRQAFFPVGARVIPNPYGTAPAFEVEHEGCVWWALPGVPHELHRLFDEVVLPALRQRWAPPGRPDLASHRFFAISESELAEWLRARLETHGIDPSDYHVRVSDGELDVRVPRAVEVAAPARERFGVRYLGEGGADLASRLVDEARARGLTLSTAESCTGGLVGSRLTAVAGVSEVYRGGWCVYSNEWKKHQLGVSEAALAQQGAVSAEVACEMARGAQKQGEVDLAVSVTGVAGPGGGSEDKPIGTVFFGLARGSDVWWRRFSFRGDRERIRSLAANQALHALWVAAREQVPESWHEAP